MKREWKALADCRGMDNSEIIDKICEVRGIEDLSEFLNPTEDALIPLDRLHNIDKAYEIVEQAIDEDKNVVILGDVDVDGVCAGSIMYRYLSHFTSHISIDINEGKEHGVKSLETSADVLIVVDSINEADEYRKFTDNGTTVLVLDHHIPPSSIEDYSHITLVSSAVDYPNPELSGAGVVWKFCKYLDDMFLTDYADEYIDLAGTAIIADMMDMNVPENRYIAYEALTNLRNVGLKAIVGSYTFDSQSVSFSVSPLINACNRMNRNQLALNIFLTDNETKAKQIVKEMKTVKEQQNELVAELMPSLIEAAEVWNDRKIISVVIDTEYGIAGLLANKLLDKYQRPVLVLKFTDDGYAGSMRACGVDNFALMVNETGLAECEGHENAAGIKITGENYEKFIESIDKKLSSVEFEEHITADIQLDIEQINTQLIENIKAINFVSGTGFKAVSVMIEGVSGYETSSMSQGKHLKLVTDNCLIIKWNDCPTQQVCDKTVDVIANVNYGYFGRTPFNQVIVNELRVRE